MELLDPTTWLFGMGLALAGAAAVLAIRAAQRRRCARAPAAGPSEPAEHGLGSGRDLIEDPDERDRAAFEVIGVYSRRITRRTRATPMSLAHMQELTGALVRDVAAQYYPLSERPELEATVENLLDMNRRVLDRLYGLIERFPFDRLRGVRLSHAQGLRENVDRLYESGAARFVRRHPSTLRAVRWGIMAYQHANPVYWARRGAIVAGREVALRKLLATTVRVVGAEAMLLYSGRDVRSERVTLERKAAREMINIALADGALTAREYREVLDFILGSAVLDAESKVALLRALVEGRISEETGLDKVTTERDRRRIEQAVQRMIDASEAVGEGRRRQVERIRSGLAGEASPAPAGEGPAGWNRRFRTVWSHVKQGGVHHGRETSAHPDSRERDGSDGRVSHGGAGAGEGA